MQAFEYQLWSPHERAKLYRRYTGDVPTEVKHAVIEIDEDEQPVETKPAEIITIQDNRYVYVSSFKWVEATSKESAGEQPLQGLTVGSEYLTIRTNSLEKFVIGDVVVLPDGSRWIITDGITTNYTYTPKQVQTYQTLPLSSVG